MIECEKCGKEVEVTTESTLSVETLVSIRNVYVKCPCGFCDKTISSVDNSSDFEIYMTNKADVHALLSRLQKGE